MSDYDDDFEDYNDTLNDRSKQGTIKRATKSKPKIGKKYDATAKDSSYDNTLARDNTIGIKGKDYSKLKKPILDPNPTPKGTKSKPSLALNTQGKQLNKKGSVYSSTPNLKENRQNDRKNLLANESHISTHRKLISFGLTKKAEQTIVPSKAMTLEQAEKLMSDAHTKIEEFKSQQNKGGNLDENLELSVKENKYLQKTLVKMQDIINKLFEK